MVEKVAPRRVSKHISGVSRDIVKTIHPPFSFRLSKRSKTYLGKIVEHIRASANTYAKSPHVDFEPIEFNAEFWDHLHGNDLYILIPESIRNNIESRPKIGRKYTFHIEPADSTTTQSKQRVSIYLVLPKPDSPDDPYSRIFHSADLSHRFFESSIRRIRIWLGVAIRFGGHLCAQTLNAYLFLSDHKKRLPNSTAMSTHTIINTEHANTALTISCSPESDIFLYRSEEWFKVFIHESFHSLGIDFSEMDMTVSNRQITRLFLGCEPDLDVRLYETYCEMWAEIINVLMLAYFSLAESRVSESRVSQSRISPKYSGFEFENQFENQKSKRNHKTRKYAKSQNHQKNKSLKNRNPTPDIAKIVSVAEQHLRYERTFTMIQAGKILKHHGMTYRDLCHGSSNMPKYRESTPVFSYYVLKSILMYHLNDFIVWCATHTRPANILLPKDPLQKSSKHSMTLSFPKSPDSIREYGELIGRLYNSDEFIKTLEEHSRRNPNGGMPNLLSDTLRMTVFEHDA